MNTPTKATVVALFSLFSTATAFAQPAPPAAAPAPAAPAAPPAPAAAPAAPASPATPTPPPAEVPPPPPAVEAPAEAAAPALSERVADLEGKVEGVNESLSVTNATLSPISKLKFSGYIQGRYEYRDDSVSGVDAQGRVTNFNRFLVRRGRLKATYTGENAEYMLQIDATGDAVVLRDAEATFVDTWTPLGLRFTMGQFKVPFGYEVLQSSSDREMPERARVIRALFPGERDRGARLTARYEWFSFMAALVNGNFTQGDAVFNTFDNNRYFDTYLRVGADFDFIVFHLSAEFGEKLGTTVGNTALTIRDVNMDGIIQPDEVTAAAVTPTMRRFGIWRLGADVQTYFDIPAVGGLSLKGEVVLSQDTNKDFRGTPADPCRDIKGFGWILTMNQNIRDYFGFAARLDQWNPNRDVSEGTSATCMSATTLASRDKITTLGLGPLLYISGNLKASAIYEHVWRDDSLALGTMGLAPSAAVASDLLTLQLQARF
jgi:hypothetical protein